MKFFLTLAVLPLLSTAYIIDPPTTAAPDTISDCTYWTIANETSTCDSIVAENSGLPLTLEQFKTYNPSIAVSCNLTVGNSYCIEQNFAIPPTTPTPTPTSTSASSTSSVPAATPTSLLEICQAQGSYSTYCDRCLSRCADETTYIAECFYSVFGTINYYDSQCWQHGGIDCANKAVDIVCPKV